VLDSGCCGLAGNFGFEAGHHDVSIACAERVLMPAVRHADDASVIAADGFSCRTQIEQGNAAGRRAMHLAELVHGAQRHPRAADERPEQRWAPRPTPPSATAGRIASVAAGAGSVAAVALAMRARRRRR
jgi:hypothetical protein